jgi:hypothetical protein
MVIIGIIMVSLLPPIITVIREKLKSKTK